MSRADRKHCVKWNSVLWLAAMALPAVLSFTLASTRFPWPILVPLLLFGPMLASNNMLIRAFGTTAAKSPDA